MLATNHSFSFLNWSGGLIALAFSRMLVLGGQEFGQLGLERLANGFVGFHEHVGKLFADIVGFLDDGIHGVEVVAVLADLACC